MGTFCWKEYRYRFLPQPNTELQMDEYSTAQPPPWQRQIRKSMGDVSGAFVPTGTLLSRTSEMEIGVEPVHRKGL